MNNLKEDLNKSIESGINYLYEHQLPNGEFCCYYAPDDKMNEWCVPDSTVFPTSLIASSVLPMKDHPKIAAVLSSSAKFLQYQMMRGGVWNYFTKWNPLFLYSPADMDDTVFAAHVLKSLQIEFTDHKNSILASRSPNGLFYTWFVLRPTKQLTRDYFMIMIREFKRPLNTLLFWFKHEVNRNDIDAVVNANVLFYLGLDETTRPVIKYLIDIIQQNKEGQCDKWYNNIFTVYYFISRNYKVIKELEPAKKLIVERILTKQNNDGSYGNSPMDTALALSVLLNFNHINSKMELAVNFLLHTQYSSGCWARNIFFYGGPSKIVGWGSEEIVTGYCLEALNSYRNVINSENQT